MGATLAAQVAPQAQGLPGSQPGTERWIIVLRNRAFSLPQALQNVRAQATPAGRATAIAALRQLAANDQALIAQAVVAGGGTVRRHFWCSSALAVEVPPTAIPILTALPRVARLFPVRAHAANDVVADSACPVPGSPPIDTSTNADNHNVSAAWGILGGYRGAGARIAVFDTGIDADVDGGTAGDQPHPAFIDNSGVTRIEAHLRAQLLPPGPHIDINSCIGTTPFSGLPTQTIQVGFRSLLHNQRAAHGTTMAAIAAGRSYALGGSLPASQVGEGHAPDARLIDVACSEFTPGVALSDWIFSDAGYLGGVEALREHILLNKPPGQTTAFVHVINLSIAGEPDPFHVINVALDALARDEDILLVTGAGNQSDTTRSSLGFYHGLAVGAVHARHPGNAGAFPPQPTNFAFVPMPQSSSGPLFGDFARFYPDVCATGAGPNFYYPIDFSNAFARSSCLVMPGVDIQDAGARTPANNVSPNRWNLGTSEACAQVAGAAALYRGFRENFGTPATAEEARAAILLNVLGTFTQADGQTANTAEQHTYTNRNRLGVGYVRDDLLAEFATRAAAIRPLAQVVTLSSTTMSATVSYGNLQPGKRYGVVACWRRWLSPESGDEIPVEFLLPDVDLDVAVQGATVARSATPANNYERVVFVAPSGASSVTLTVRLASLPISNQLLQVQLVAREFADELDPSTSVLDPVHAATGHVQSLPAGQGCTQAALDWQVDRIVPTGYANAYGSAPFFLSLPPPPPPVAQWATHEGYARGFDLARGRFATAPLGNPSYSVRATIEAAQVGGAMNISGLALRTWAPFPAAVDLPIDVRLSEGTGAPSPWTTTTAKALGGTSGELRPDRFEIVIPLGAAFVYTGAGALHVDFRVAGPSVPAFHVDGTNDAPPVAYRATYSYYDVGTFSQVNVTMDGQVPLIGLIAAGSPATTEALLELLREPWSGNSGAAREVLWRLSRTPPSSAWFLMMGDVLATPVPMPACLSWLDNPQSLVAITTDAAGLARGTLNVPVGAVHSHFGLQCVSITGAVWNFPSYRFTNALRVTVGGGL